MKQNQLENVIIFAARYAHNRPTGAAMQVCHAIMAEWGNLRPQAQMQLQKESFEATENQECWQKIRNLTAQNTK